MSSSTEPSEPTEPTEPAETIVPVVNSVVFNAVDLDRSVAFWSALLVVEVGNEVPGLFVWLRPQRKGGISVAIQKVDAVPEVDNAVHIDTGVADLDAGQARIVELGGRHVATHQFSGFEWRIMADPEGHRFCIARHSD